MKLFNRQKSDPADVANQQYYASPGSEGQGGIDWKRAAPRIAGIAIIVILVVLGILWAAGVFSNDKPAAKKTTQPQTAKTQTAVPKPAAKSQTGSSSSSSASKPTQPTPSGTSVATTNGSLTNSGPGDTIALFAGVTVVGALGYHIRLRRQLS